VDRREFFRKSFGKASQAVVKQVDERVSKRAKHWIRPPFAITEIEFLLACTRCKDCISACPHEVIFPLPSRLGVDVVGTPAMDLINKACHMCEDWPCVEVCEPKALIKEDDAGVKYNGVKLARVSINTETCLPYQGPECGACESACPVENALLFDMTKPVIKEEHCTGCALCREACIVEPSALNVHSLSA